MSKTAIILGATGLTGNILLEKLIHDNRYSTIKLFSRTTIGFTNPKIKEHLIDLLQLEKYQKIFNADEVYCCIGTTNAKTPDKNLYTKIDYGIPISAAKLCKQNNIKTFLIISAIGADASSNIFYNKIKGQMEHEVLKLKIHKTHILQPSLIAGNRLEKRTGEYLLKKIMNLLNPILIGCLKKYRSIHPETIVETMIWLANNSHPNQKITSNEIQNLSTQ